VTGRVGKGRIAFVAAAASCFLLLSASDSAGQRPGVGRGVSIDVEPDGRGRLIADEVELLSEPRSFSIRGQVEALDLAEGRLVVLGVSIRLDSLKTEWVDQPGTMGVQRIEERVAVGDWIEVKAKRDSPAGDLVARSIETLDVKPSSTLKGTIGEIDDDVAFGDGTYAILLAGVPVLIESATDFEEPDTFYEELFGEQKSEDALGDNPEYRLHVGERVFLSGSVRPSARLEDSYRLNNGAEDLFGVGESSVRLEALGIVSSRAKVFAQLRTRGNYQLYRSADIAEGVESGSQTQLRQLYLSWRDIGGRPVGLVAGKQRVRDEREFMFDDYLDGVRLYAYPWSPIVLEASFFVPVAPLSDRYRTWRDVLIQGRYYVGDEWQARAFVLQRFDSDIDRNRDSRYLGLAVDGRQGPVRAWGAFTQLRGEDKGRQQDAYAWDVGVSGRAGDWPGRPNVSVGAAMGTGDLDSSDNVSNEFRQTGYEDNSARLWGLGRYKNFGEVLDPELSNIRILTASVGLRPHRNVSLDLVFHSYRQHQADKDFDRVDLETPAEVLNGDDPRIGEEVDLIFAARKLFGFLAVAYKVGAFMPGPAFEADGRFAMLHRLEFRVGF